MWGDVGAQWEKARELFELMQQQGCTPDVVTYTALISAYERGGKWQLALQVASLATARAEVVTAYRSGRTISCWVV